MRVEAGRPRSPRPLARVRHGEPTVVEPSVVHGALDALETRPREGSCSDPVPEAEQRGRVDREHLGPASERGREVGARLRARARRDAHGQPAGGLTSPVSTSASACPPPGQGKAWTIAPTRGARLPSVGPGRDEHEHDGCPGVEDLAHQARPGRPGGSGPPRHCPRPGPAAEHLRAVAEHDDGDVSPAGGLDRSGDLRTVRAAELAAFAYVRFSTRARRLVEDGRDLDPEGSTSGCLGSTWVGRRSSRACERVVRERADDGDPAARERQEAAVVREQHDGLSRANRARSAGRARRRRWSESTSSGRVPALVRRPSKALWARTRRSAVDEAPRRSPARTASTRGRRRRACWAALDVDARRERAAQPRQASRPHGAACAGRGCPSSRRRRPLKAPLLAQDPGEQAFVGGRGDTVDVGVGVHDRADLALGDDHLEGRQDDVGELARTHRGGGEVTPARETE